MTLVPAQKDLVETLVTKSVSTCIQLIVIPVVSNSMSHLPVIEECEANPCENGGSCTKHVSDYLCTCLPGYTGTLCQSKCSYTLLARLFHLTNVIFAMTCHNSTRTCNMPFRCSLSRNSKTIFFNLTCHVYY